MSRNAKGGFFKELQSFETDYSPNVITQYESQRTGMRVVVVDQKGPKVNGYFTLATEIHDDSGAPHTLEHLVFMGSKNYRYKGVLDKLATRAYSRTNAWTATDHTAYTLDTAGWEGFAQILPVYLEHVLLPTLTDAGCYTEVHHVDGTGQDAGVVYSEMQGVQNDQGELMDLKARRLLYPENVGFRYETGGMMEHLRVLTADRIRAFHREMYQPKNLCLILIGEVDHPQLLEILDTFEGSILTDIPAPDAPWKRPWVESPPTPPIAKSVIETVEFPEEDESSGEILVGFLGPDVNDIVLTTAISILLVYLAGSSASLLENTLVEKEQVASAVYYSVDNRPDLVIWFVLSSVTTEKLGDVEKRFFELLRDAASKPLDLEYLRDCARRERIRLKFQTEGSGSAFSSFLITDFLFGKKDGSTLLNLATLKEYDELLEWSDDQWRNFLKKWISDAPHVTILGVPSAKLSEKLKADEQSRIEDQKKRLGEEGLKKLEKRLEEAKAENDKEIPRSVLEQFTVPGTDSIHFINSTTAKSGLARADGVGFNDIQEIIDKDKPDVPLYLHFEHIKSNFVHITILISTDSVPVEMRPLLSIFLENFFNTPVMRDGKRVEFEQVVVDLERDTVGYNIDGGDSLGNPEGLSIRFQVERENYNVAISWIERMLWWSVYDKERMNATVTKLLADIPEEKRSGSSMVSAVNKMIQYAPGSISRARNTLVKALYLKRIKQLLKKDPKQLQKQMELLVVKLCRHENFRILVIADIERLVKPVTSWASFITPQHAGVPLNPLDSRKDRLSDAGKNPGDLAYLVPMPTTDSSYSLNTARGPDSYNHPQLPALMVALAYLDAVEGPLWVAVRGTGLAYGTGFYRSTESGHLQFQIYRSPDAYKAFVASRQVIQDHISGKAEFEPPALEGAISTIVVGFADEQPSMSSAAQMSFVNQVIRGLHAGYNKKILALVREVTVPEIRAVLKEVVMPVFAPEYSNLVITCAPVMEESLKKGFETEGFPVQVKPLAFFQDDYGLKGSDDDDDAMAENDDDEEDDEDAEGEGDEEFDGGDDDADDDAFGEVEGGKGQQTLG